MTFCLSFQFNFIDPIIHLSIGATNKRMGWCSTYFLILGPHIDIGGTLLSFSTSPLHRTSALHRFSTFFSRIPLCYARTLTHTPWRLPAFNTQSIPPRKKNLLDTRGQSHPIDNFARPTSSCWGEWSGSFTSSIPVKRRWCTRGGGPWGYRYTKLSINFLNFE